MSLLVEHTPCGLLFVSSEVLGVTDEEVNNIDGVCLPRLMSIKFSIETMAFELAALEVVGNA